MRKSLIVILTFGFISTSCTRYVQKVFYKSFLATYIVNRVDKFFDLNTQQEQQLKKDVNKLLLWHKRTQLQLYANDLFKLRQLLKDGLGQKDLSWLEGRIMLHRNRLYGRVIPIAVDFLATVDKAQVHHMAKVLKEENDELAKALKAPKKQRYIKKAKELEERLENFTGDLASSQKKQIYKYVEALPDTVPDWLAYRRIKQNEFVDFLLAKPDRAALKKKMQDFLLYQEKLFPKRFKSRFKRAYRAMLEALLKVYPLLDASQRKAVDTRLAEYQQLAIELSLE